MDLIAALLADVTKPEPTRLSQIHSKWTYCTHGCLRYFIKAVAHEPHYPIAMETLSSQRRRCRISFNPHGAERHTSPQRHPPRRLVQ
jgi:hypothetical protein